MSAHKSPHVAPWPLALDRVPPPLPPPLPVPLSSPALTPQKLEPSLRTCM